MRVGHGSWVWPATLSRRSPVGGGLCSPARSRLVDSKPWPGDRGLDPGIARDRVSSLMRIRCAIQRDQAAAAPRAEIEMAVVDERH
jgi:hypothetical protein